MNTQKFKKYLIIGKISEQTKGFLRGKDCEISRPHFWPFHAK